MRWNLFSQSHSVDAQNPTSEGRFENYAQTNAGNNEQLVKTTLLMTFLWIVLVFLALGRLSAQQLSITQLSDQTTQIGRAHV